MNKSGRLYFSLLSAAATVLLLWCVQSRVSAEAEPWLSPSVLSITKQADVPGVPNSISGNIDCIPQGIYTCTVTTAFGSADMNGNVRLNNTGGFHESRSYIEHRPRLIPIPNSNTVLSYTTEPAYGVYIYFTKNFTSSIAPTPSFGSLYYQINRQPDAKLVDKNGLRLPVDTSSVSFSTDGRWMVLSSPNRAIMRVNLETFEVLSFASGYNYTIGLSPNPKTAITNDGRYVAVASKDYSDFTVYDLESCSAVQGSPIGMFNCPSRDLQTLLQQKIPGYITASRIRFLNNSTLSFYSTYAAGSTQKIAKFVITSGENLHQLQYLAMGDSYISGEGVYSYQEGTDTGNNRCHLSVLSYPYILSRRLAFDSFHSVACSGAKIADVIDTGANYEGQAEPKIKRASRNKNDVNNTIAAFLPGYLGQLEFVARNQPKILTLSVGGNDMGFSHILRRCLGPDTCYNTYEDRLELVREINRQFDSLVGAYQQIKNTGAADARAYIIGYPQIAKPGGNCALNVHLNNDEIVFSNLVTGYINRVIKAAADKVGLAFIDISDSLYGHRLCETKSSAVAVHGLSAGNDFPDFLNGPIGNESFHPNRLGHRLLAEVIFDATEAFEKPMPAANPLSTLPPETSLDLLSPLPSGRAVSNKIYDETMSDGTIYKQSGFQVNVAGFSHGLKPLTNYSVSIHSDPISLGTYLTDSSGNLSFSSLLPSSFPAGWHELEVSGVNLEGQQITIHKTIYVGVSPSDLNGDGVTDPVSGCIVSVTNQDYDKDGIDDACDASISEPPVFTAAGSPAKNLIAASAQEASTPDVNVPPPDDFGFDSFSAHNNQKTLGTETAEPQQNKKGLMGAAVVLLTAAGVFGIKTLLRKSA